MSVAFSCKQYIPAEIGEFFGGGYFAGYISHTANGSPTHALIVAPRATGASGGSYPLSTYYQWKTTNTFTSGATSDYDGRANTDAIIAAGIDDHPAAKFCVDLNIDGYTDWYLPTHLEMDIAYFNLKPTTNNNTTSWGINNYSVPRRTSNYTITYPPQTSISMFQSGGSQAFLTLNHWLSMQPPSFLTTKGAIMDFIDGRRNDAFGSAEKTSTTNVVRAFRRIPITKPTFA